MFTYEQLISQYFFLNYSNKFKNDIINSLVNGNILIKDNNYLYLNESNVEIIENNLIEIYLSNINVESQLIDNSIELAHDREDIVKTLINYNLKINSMDRNKLFEKLETDISLFQLTKDIYDNAINKMVKFDYITIDNNRLNKCIY
jgi:hypothetical protein